MSAATVSTLSRIRLWFFTCVALLVPIGMLVLLRLLAAPGPGDMAPWVTSGRYGLLVAAMFLLGSPFLLERIFTGPNADVLRSRSIQPELLVLRIGVASGFLVWWATFILYVSGGQRSDLHVATVLSYCSVLYWSIRYRHLYFGRVKST